MIQRFKLNREQSVFHKNFAAFKYVEYIKLRSFSRDNFCN